MAKATQRQLVATLLQNNGTLWSEQMGIQLRDKPSPLFRWLCGSLLLSARISQDIAVKAAKALAEQGWTTPQKLADTTWAQRTKVLNHCGYARYDERTSRMLGESTSLLLQRYGGDLRRLRQQAQRDPQELRQRLMQFKGIGELGADIFCREVQTVWDELYPYVDGRCLQAAERLGLGHDPRTLARLVPRDTFASLVAGLVRIDLQGTYQDVEEQALQRP